MSAFYVKYRPVPKGSDAFYVFIPGQVNCFYIRPDWKERDNLTLKAITHLGRQASALKALSGGREEIWLGCCLLDFLFEPAAFVVRELDDAPDEKVIPFHKRQALG